jgi:hypothetical protein
MVLNFIVNNLMNKINSSNLIMNGGKQSMQMSNGVKTSSIFLLFLLAIFLLLIKGFIVYILYNYLVPEIIYSLSNKSKEDIENDFKPISFIQSILLVILFNTLFCG